MENSSEGSKKWWQFWKSTPPSDSTSNRDETIEENNGTTKTDSVAKGPDPTTPAPKSQKKALTDTEREHMKNVLNEPVRFNDDLLPPLPQGWTGLESVFFLAQSAALQRQPVNDLILAGTSVALMTGIRLEGKMQPVLDWAEACLNSGHLALAFAKHAQAILPLGPTILRNHVLPMLQDLADRVGDSDAINNGVVTLTSELWGTAEKDVERNTNAADKGDVQSMYLLGRNYSEGNGVPQDHEQAMQWYQVAADGGSAQAMYYLGEGYEQGRGVAVDHQKGLEWFIKAGNNGSIAGMIGAGMYYDYGEDDIPQNYEKAIEWYQKAGADNSPYIKSRLGLFYLEGAGVEQDIDKGMQLLTEAAELGHEGAMGNLGDIYQAGKLVAQDSQKAAMWYERGAEKGDIGSMVNIGFYYSNAIGVEQDHNKAVAWYRKAADLGNAQAINNLGDAYENGFSVAQDYGKAMELYTKAADMGNGMAMYGIGNLYEKGWGVPIDLSQARLFYQKAADAGDQEAIEALQNLNSTQEQPQQTRATENSSPEDLRSKNSLNSSQADEQVNFEYRVKQLIGAEMQLEPEEIHATSTLESLGLDSLDGVELLMAIEDKFDLEIPDSDANNITTFNGLVAYLNSKRGLDVVAEPNAVKNDEESLIAELLHIADTIAWYYREGSFSNFGTKHIEKPKSEYVESGYGLNMVYKRVLEIGKELDAIDGRAAMRRAHAQMAQVGFGGWEEPLSKAWSGIGDWLH